MTTFNSGKRDLAQIYQPFLTAWTGVQLETGFWGKTGLLLLNLKLSIFILINYFDATKHAVKQICTRVRMKLERYLLKWLNL